MINVCFDWNCIIALEEERKFSPALRQIREWYKQGEIVLCISRPSRMENHPSRDKRFYDENEWNEKLRNIELEGMELRSSKPRFLNYWGIEQILIREVHDRLFPNVAFIYRDYAQDQNVEVSEPHGLSLSSQSLQEEIENETQVQRHLGRKWNNMKNDALSIHAFGTWSGPDDVFVTTDEHHLLKRRAKLQSPYMVKVSRPVKAPGNDKELIMQEKLEEFPGHIVIPGYILDPQETVEYLWKRLEEQNESDSVSRSDGYLLVPGESN